MKALRCLTAAALLTCAATTALAAGEHKPSYGGVVVEVREIQYELVAGPDTIALYVEDHGTPVDTRGATAKVTLLTGNEKSEVTLAPAGRNKFEAKGAFKVGPGTKAVAVVTLPGKPPATARFALK